MRIVDANVLLYAINADEAHHDESKDWLDAALSGSTSVGLAWLPLLAFVRVATKSGVSRSPLTTDEAMDQVVTWLAQPAAHLVEPTERHPDILRSLLRAAGTGGNLVGDAHLAALAIEHRADIVTYDRDFARFPGVRSAAPSAF